MKKLALIILLMMLAFSECIEDEEVELWGECYNIEETTELSYSNTELGEIPPEIGDLINLVYISITYNSLTGEIPPEIGNLINLERLILYSNELTGEIPPEIGNLINLEQLVLSKNQLTGAIPPEIGNLINLDLLWFDENLLDSIPPNICNLDENLINNYQQTNDIFYPLFLYGDNLICDEVPECLDSSPGINYSISDFSSQGGLAYAPQKCLCNIETEAQLWEDCYNIEETTELNYSYTELGEIPKYIGDLINLTYIHISDCYISGRIPNDFQHLENLIYLQIYDNNLDLPDSLNLNIDSQLIGSIGVLGVLPLEYLDLRNNILTGPINSIVGHSGIRTLKSILLSGNQLTGSIPQSFNEIEELEVLDLSGNQLTGIIPPSFDYFSNLTFLSLAENELSGSIPTEISNLESLYLLNLSSNNLIGQIPAEFESLDLFYLALNDNQLIGDIPISFCEYDYLFLSNNQFCPIYPECLSDEHLGYQDVSECVECSYIPSDLNNDLSLDVLDIILTINCILSDTCSFCSDLNEDGYIDILDVILLVNIIIPNNE